MKRSSLFYLLLLFFLIFSKSVSAKISKSREKVLFNNIKAGEWFRWRASVGGIEGGTLELLTRKLWRRRGQLFVRAELKARTNPFFDNIHKVNNRFYSIFSFSLGGKFHYHLDADQAGIKQTRDLYFSRRGRFGYVTLKVKYIQSKYRPWKKRYRVPPETRDLIGGLYYARFLPYEPNKKYSFYVFILGYLWKVEGGMVEKKKIYSPLGSFRAFRVKARAVRLRKPGPPKHIDIWLSDDSRRIPLLISGPIPRIGTAKAELIGYRPHYKASKMTEKTRKKKKNLWKYITDF